METRHRITTVQHCRQSRACPLTLVEICLSQCQIDLCEAQLKPPKVKLAQHKWIYLSVRRWWLRCGRCCPSTAEITSDSPGCPEPWRSRWELTEHTVRRTAKLPPPPSPGAKNTKGATFFFQQLACGLLWRGHSVFSVKLERKPFVRFFWKNHLGNNASCPAELFIFHHQKMLIFSFVSVFSKTEKDPNLKVVSWPAPRVSLVT